MMTIGIASPKIITSAHHVAKVAQRILLECIANFPGYCLKSNYVATEIKAKTRAVIEVQRGGAETQNRNSGPVIYNHA
jgi:hypothetical protein